MSYDSNQWDNPPEYCKHNRTGYCFDCVRERHNQEVLDGKYDDIDDDIDDDRDARYDERDHSTWA